METTLITRDIESLIFEFRGFKVMLDTDLAAFYETETKILKQQVRRNSTRFPEDFMFELTKEEKKKLVANCDRLSNLKHSSVNPMVFTEQGVAMLSAVLHSDKAIQINIEIMRAFVYYRQLILSGKEVNKQIKDLDTKIEYVFRFLLDKIEHKKQSYTPVGFDYPNKK